MRAAPAASVCWQTGHLAARICLQGEVSPTVGIPDRPAEHGDGLRNPIGWNVISCRKLADRIDPGCLDRRLHLCCDRAGAEPHDTDALIRILLVGDARQSHRRGLGRAVVRPAFQKGIGGAGREIDDGSPPCATITGIA